MSHRAVARVRTTLASAGYSADGIAAAGVDPGLGVRRGDVPVLLRALRPVEPLATLVRLFLLGQDVASGEFERRLGDAAAAFVDAGLVERRGSRVAPLVSLTPWRGAIVAHDPDPVGELWAEHVSGPTPAAETLAQLIVDLPVDRALDLGTGSGLLAVLVARHARDVVATDVNERALELASLTAGLSGASNVEVRAGSLFEPVADDRFGLIVSNPPFVISPETELLFRHSPLARDELSATVVRETAAHLEVGGFAVVMANWIQRPDAPWREVPAAWVADTGCDALLLLHGVEDALAYAVRWNLRLQQLNPTEYPDVLARWVDYFGRERIESIASGVVVLRRRPGRNWVHGLELGDETRGSAGAHLVAIFAAQDYLADEPSVERLFDTAFAIPAAHRLDQSLRSRGAEYVVDATSLSLEDGLGIRAMVDPDLVPILLRLDGSQTLGDAIGEVAALTGVDATALAERALTFVRDLLARGFAAPVER